MMRTLSDRLLRNGRATRWWPQVVPATVRRPTALAVLAALLAGTVAAPMPVGGAESGAPAVGVVATYLGAPARPGQLDDPAGVATDGTYLYVVDWNQDRIVKYRAKDLRFVKAFGSEGIGRGQFRQPLSIAVADGYAYVTDTGNARLVRLATGRLDGTGWKVFTGTKATGPLADLMGIAVDHGSLYYSQSTFFGPTAAESHFQGWVTRIDARRFDGTGWKRFGGEPATPSTGSGSASRPLEQADAIAVVGGTVYVAEQNTLVSFSTDLTGEGWAEPGSNWYFDVRGFAAVGGHLFIAGRRPSIVDMPFGPTSEAKNVPVRIGSLGGAAAIGDTVYATETSAGRLVAFDPISGYIARSTELGVGLAPDQLYAPWAVVTTTEGVFVLDGDVPGGNGYGSMDLKVMKLTTDGTLRRVASAPVAVDGASMGNTPTMFAAGGILAIVDRFGRAGSAISAADLRPVAMSADAVNALAPPHFFDDPFADAPTCKVVDATQLASLGVPAAAIAGATCSVLDADLVQVTFGEGQPTVTARVDPTTGAWLATRQIEGTPWLGLLARTPSALYLRHDLPIGEELLTLDPLTLAGDCPIPLGDSLSPVGPGPDRGPEYEFIVATGAPGDLYVASGQKVVQLRAYPDMAACAAAGKR